jgi:CheY-like chemotaxis protein
MEGCVDTLMGRALSRGLALVSFVDPALPAVVRADGGRIRQILLNLIDNAVKFTPAGEVALHVSLQKRVNGICLVRFEVSDSGIGIEAQALPRLFQPFIQADSSVTRKYGGTGLGLSICKRLLELMGSAIEVDSKPGQGSVFRFELALPEVAAPAAVPALPSERALVLTPFPRHAAAIAGYLRAWGMQPCCAASEDEALRLIDAAGHALAVIDGRMPQAYASAHMLATRQPGLRLLLLADSDEAQETAARQGFHASLRRPFRQSAVYQAVAFALERRHYMAPPTHRAPADVGREPGGAGGHAHRAGKLILLVEDNPTNQKVALHQLTRLGYAAHVASNGEEALRALALHEYALILMDCQMPLLDGFEATRRIRAAERAGCPRIPIVAMTANAAEGDRKRCLEAGMDDYLAKPIVREALAALLRQRAPLSAHPAGA